MAGGYLDDFPNVFCSQELIDHAKAIFPSGGLSDEEGHPTFEFFCQGPLKAAAYASTRDFDQAPLALLEDDPDNPVDPNDPNAPEVRVLTEESAFFGRLEFLVLRSGDMFELLDFEHHPNPVDDVDDWP